MPSPFPGMNPYLEHPSVWQDFHESLIPALRAQLSPQVAPRYFVKIEEHVFLHELSAEDRRQRIGSLDVGLQPVTTARIAAAATTLIEAPAQVLLAPAIDVERLSYLEVRDREGHQVVTVIEVLSPSNKNSGPDREQYLGKRLQFLSSSAHFVEVDLLRGGPRMPLEQLADCDYYALVSRSEHRPRAGIWPLYLAERLPIIPIPLRGEESVRLDLQEALHRVYDEAGYAYHIYTRTPDPPLTLEQEQWARTYLPQSQ